MSGTAYRLPAYPTSEQGPFARRVAAVYFLDPPLLTDSGVSPYVIIASTPERVDVFPADEDGCLAAWEGPEFFGRLSHDQVLLALGYIPGMVRNG